MKKLDHTNFMKVVISMANAMSKVITMNRMYSFDCLYFFDVLARRNMIFLIASFIISLYIYIYMYINIYVIINNNKYPYPKKTQHKNIYINKTKILIVVICGWRQHLSSCVADPIS